jgi:hypothetical protein
MVHRLSNLAITKEDYCYIPVGSYELDAKPGASAQMPTGFLAGDPGNGRMTQGLVQYYRATGYEPALKLAKKSTNYLRITANSTIARVVSSSLLSRRGG